jgi:hypothetical protein
MITRAVLGCNVNMYCYLQSNIANGQHGSRGIIHFLHIYYETQSSKIDIKTSATVYSTYCNLIIICICIS